MLKCDRQSCCLCRVYFPLNSFALCLAVLNANTCPVWTAPKRVAVYVENNRQPGISLGFWTELVSAVCSECYVTALFRSPLLIFWQCRIWRAQISGLNLMSVCHTLFGLKQCVCVCECAQAATRSVLTTLTHIHRHTQVLLEYITLGITVCFLVRTALHHRLTSWREEIPHTPCYEL